MPDDCKENYVVGQRRDTSSSYQVFNEIMENLLGEYPESHINEIQESADFQSLRGFALKIGVHKNTLRTWLNKFLISKYGEERTKSIKNSLWKVNRPEDSDQKRLTIINLFKAQIKEYFPNDIENINSLGYYVKNFNVGFVSLKEWVIQYLNKEYGQEATKIYERIFPTLSLNSPTHDKLKAFISARGGVLETSLHEWNELKEQPTKRRIKIRCNKGHQWIPLVTNIIHDTRWCPGCHSKFCESTMREIMEELFGVPFPETTFNKAFGIPWNKEITINGYKIHIGKLKYDGYNAAVKIDGQFFKISFEYDGIQHDEFKEYFHKSLEDFQFSKLRDIEKNNISVEKDVFMIRLKEIDGFTKKTINSFKDEILRQFQKDTKFQF